MGIRQWRTVLPLKGVDLDAVPGLVEALNGLVVSPLGDACRRLRPVWITSELFGSELRAELLQLTGPPRQKSPLSLGPC